MINDEGKLVDVYIPRKCSETNALITPKDHSAVQINVGIVDAKGNYTGQYKTVAFCGKTRKAGLSDNAMNRFCLKNKIMADIE